MIRKLLLYCATSLLLFSCSKKLVPRNNNIAFQQSLDAENTEILNSLTKTTEALVNAGGNRKRGKAIIKRVDELSLRTTLKIEKIDWLSSQKNYIIKIPGQKDSIIYLVSHYDKTDVNPLTFVSTMLNGVLDNLISWSYSTDGAIDNATGVAVNLQLAQTIASRNNKYTYHILLVGSEETGLRGSRAHVARLPLDIFNKILFVINTDVIGVKNKSNCVSTNVSNSRLSDLSLKVATELNLPLKTGKIPPLACSDYAPFKKTSWASDFGRSLQFNLVGAFIPQRSYFTEKKETEIINFTSCDILDITDYLGATVLLPIGNIHGFRDKIEMVDEIKLYQHYKLIDGFLKNIEELHSIEF